MFFDTLLVIFIFMPLELLNYFFMTKIMGFGEPYPQTIVLLRVRWKYLWGEVPTHEEIVVEKGYMYSKLHYKDGTTLLWRE